MWEVRLPQAADSSPKCALHSALHRMQHTHARAAFSGSQRHSWRRRTDAAQHVLRCTKHMPGQQAARRQCSAGQHAAPGAPHAPLRLSCHDLTPPSPSAPWQSYWRDSARARTHARSSKSSAAYTHQQEVVVPGARGARRPPCNAMWRTWRAAPQAGPPTQFWLARRAAERARACTKARTHAAATAARGAKVVGPAEQKKVSRHSNATQPRLANDEMARSAKERSAQRAERTFDWAPRTGRRAAVRAAPPRLSLAPNAAAGSSTAALPHAPPQPDTGQHPSSQRRMDRWLTAPHARNARAQASGRRSGSGSLSTTPCSGQHSSTSPQGASTSWFVEQAAAGSLNGSRRSPSHASPATAVCCKASSKHRRSAATTPPTP